jgi:hypothetical protein
MMSRNSDNKVRVDLTFKTDFDARFCNFPHMDSLIAVLIVSAASTAIVYRTYEKRSTKAETECSRLATIVSEQDKRLQTLESTNASVVQQNADYQERIHQLVCIKCCLCKKSI